MKMIRIYSPATHQTMESEKEIIAEYGKNYEDFFKNRNFTFEITSHYGWNLKD